MVMILMSSRAKRGICFSIFLAFAPSTTASAQKSDTASVCWSARNIAKCKTWMITESAIEIPLTSSRSQRTYSWGESYYVDDFSPQVSVTLGGMVNGGPKDAFGATWTATGGEVHHRVELRYRRWLADWSGIDVSFGYAGGMVSGREGAPKTQADGLTAAIGISGTYLGADARFIVLPTHDGRTLRNTSAGIRFGSRAGPITAACALAIVVIGVYANGPYT